MLTHTKSFSTSHRITRRIQRLKATSLHACLALSLVLFTPSPTISAIKQAAPEVQYRTSTGHLAAHRTPLS